MSNLPTKLTVTYIDTGDIYSIPLNYIYQVVGGTAWLSDSHVAVGELVFTQDSLDLVLIYIRQWYRIGDGDSLNNCQIDSVRSKVYQSHLLFPFSEQ